MGKILIVDDSTYARRVHRTILERAGYSVVEAATGHGAIETFSLEHPDAVLLDLSMEDIGGLDVLDTLHQLNPASRIIIVSADIQRSTEQAAMARGAERFLGKPANPEQLVAAVGGALKERSV